MGTSCRGGRSIRRWWRRWYQVLRAYTHCHRLHRVRLPLLSSLSLLSPSSTSSSSSFSSFAAPSRVFPLTRFSRLPWVGRSQHRLIRPSFVRIPTRIPDLLCRAKVGGRGEGEPDLSPLNGINKLYYACTSPWNTIPAGGLVRTTGEGFVPSRLNPLLSPIGRSLPVSSILTHAYLSHCGWP